MSFFCTSCQATRSLLSRNSGRFFLVSRNYRQKCPSSQASSPFKPFQFNYQPSANLKCFNRVRISEANVSKDSLFCGDVPQQGFCTNASKPEANSEGVEEGGGNSKSLVGSSDSEQTDYNLTEEEKHILEELEEEERRIREMLAREGDEEEYFVWDGKFDNAAGGSGYSGKLAGSVSEDHVTFENRQRIIQDVIEEMWNPLPQIDEEQPEEPEYYPRGKTGVFDLGELIELLKEEHADEVVAITFPKELDYADYMVIVTVNNNKHLLALAQFVRKRFKMKDRKSTDKLPVLNRSVNHQGWIALDLGNIILHIFIQKTRDYYDLETLWTVGPIYDDLTNAKDPEIVQLLNSIK